MISSNLATKIASAAVSTFIGFTLFKNFTTDIRRILITGSNKGIGYGIAKYILQNTSNYHVIISGRNEQSINNAVQSLINISPSYKPRISTLMIDVSKQKQIQSASIELQRKFGAKLNLYCIVNNAGIFPEMNTKRRNLDIATQTIQTNFWGLVNVTQYFGPLLLSNESRIVNISSSGGPENVSKMSEDNKKVIMNENISMMELTEFINKFLNIYSKYHGNGNKKEFDLNAYEFSKACVNAFTCFIAPKMEILKNKNVLINCCNPGLVDTEMAKNYNSNSKKSIKEGIQTPIKLILGNINGKSGGFYGGNKGEQYCLDRYIPFKN
eukprot:148442_1